MAQSIISSAMNDPAANINATATQGLSGSTVAQPTGIINTAVAAGSTPAPTPAPTAAPIAPTAAPASVSAPGAATTPDFRSQVGDLYQSLLGRQADQAGLGFYTQNMGTGTTLDQVRDSIMNSDEYKALHAPKPPVAPTASVAGYTAAQLGNPTAWNVTGEQTVAGQLGKILDPNSPIIQQARTQGLELANERGLLNSSIGETAAMDSAYRAAVPIATSDASTYAKAAGYNADEQNQFAVHNVDAKNDASRANLSAQTQVAIANLQAQTQTNLAYLDNQTKTNLANLSNDNQIKLANIEAQYHTVMQANASAQNLYSQITQNIATISASKDLDGAAKQAAVDNQLQLLKNGMQINGAISNLNLGDLLNFAPSSAGTQGIAAGQPAPGIIGGATL
jgi:hypothetical protein